MIVLRQDSFSSDEEARRAAHMDKLKHISSEYNRGKRQERALRLKRGSLSAIGGATTGALLGNIIKHPVRGALIGAAVGGIAGGVSAAKENWKRGNNGTYLARKAGRKFDKEMYGGMDMGDVIAVGPYEVHADQLRKLEKRPESNSDKRLRHSYEKRLELESYLEQKREEEARKEAREKNRGK